jgi:group I intron endonuclease
MVYGVIYKITNSINNKVYYGQTKSKLPNARWNRHKYSVNIGCKVPIHCAMRLYGVENFKFEIVYYCNTLEELNSKEIELISLNNTLCPNGYNVMKGGDNYERTEEHKRKIGDAHRGKKKSLEHIEKMSLTRKGVKRGPFTEEHKRKIGDALRGKKKPQSPEHTAKIVKSLIGRKHSPETIEKIRQARIRYHLAKHDNKSITSAYK